MANIKKNFLYSSFLTTANYIFPMITYPYVSRVLGVDNIGLCNFVDSLIGYFLTFSIMGISIIGTREIAKAKGNQKELDKVYSSLFTINTISTGIALIALIIATFAVPKLWEHKEMMMVGGMRLLFSYLAIEWFFRGMEEFKFITIRSLAVKCVYVASVFIFVHEKDDYIIYFLLMNLMVVVNAIINVWYARRFASMNFRLAKPRPYIKPFFTLGFYNIITSLYCTFNTVLLGFTSNETEVGYFTTATKFYSIALGLFSAFTGVMLPRMSALLGEGKNEEFKALVSRSISVLLAFAIPIIVYTVVFAPQIIRIVSGEGYEGAVTPMRIVMPLMLVIGYEQILIIQALMPMKADRYILRNSIIGAVTGLTLNVILVPMLQSVGAAIVWLCGELAVLISAQFAVRHLIGLSFPWQEFSKSVCAHAPLLILLVGLNTAIPANTIALCIVSGIIVVAYSYVLNMYVVRNAEVVNIVSSMKRRLHLSKTKK